MLESISSQMAKLWGMFWRVPIGFFLLIALAASGMPQSPNPTLIPAMQSWSSLPGSYQFTAQSRIVVADSTLTGLGQTFSQDLFDLTGMIIPVTVNESLQAGDLALVKSALVLPGVSESYELDIGSAVTVSSATSSGLFWGTRSVLQLLRQSFTLSAGTGQDWPLYQERGFMLDVGEKFFPLDFLKRHIREMAYLKMNYFHIHLSQDGGFRLESNSHPEIVSVDHYTKAEIQELINLAAQYHITVVPEIDVPSHATAMLQSHPELQLPNHPEMIDLSKPGAYTLVQDLLDEYLPFFPAPYWHTGGDEYLLDKDYALYPQYTQYAQQLYGPQADGQDLYVGFINWVDGIVRSHQKQLRAWNDVYGLSTVVNKPNKDIILDMFAANIGAANALSQGIKINNCSPQPLYYVLGVNSERADPRNLYENWAPNLQFVLNESVPPQSQGLLGAKLHVWCDFPDAETIDQVQQGIFASFRSFSQNSWGSLRLTASYNDFLPIISAIGRVPGFDPDFGIVLPSPSLNENQPFNLLVKANSSFNGAVQIACSVSDPSLNCSVSTNKFFLQPTQQQTISITVTSSTHTASLFESKYFLLTLGLIAGCVLVGSRERRIIPLVTLLILCLVGCGGSSQRVQFSGPLVTVSVNAGSLSHTATIRLNSGG
jgi:hexosaminidase